MQLEMSFCLTVGPGEMIDPVFALSLVGQTAPVQVLGRSMPGEIVRAEIVDHGVEVYVQFEAPPEWDEFFRLKPGDVSLG